jgi:hypothetical protein
MSRLGKIKLDARKRKLAEYLAFRNGHYAGEGPFHYGWPDRRVWIVRLEY